MTIPMTLALAVSGAGAQSDSKPVPADPPALTVMSDAFAKLDAIAGEAEAVFKEPGGEHRYGVRFTLRRPNFARYEYVEAKEGGQNLLLVADGKDFFMYDARAKGYVSSPLEAGSPPILWSGSPGLPAVLRSFFEAPAVKAGTAQAWWKEEWTAAADLDEDVGGEPCSVATLKSREGEMIRIFVSKKTGFVRKISDGSGEGGSGSDAKYSLESTWSFKGIDAAPKLDEKTFVFTPPPGAKKVEDFESPEAVLLPLGGEAPEMAGPSPTAGKDLKLSDLKGKLVLLNFWFYH